MPRYTKERDSLYVKNGAKLPLGGKNIYDLVGIFEDKILLEEPFCRTELIPIEGYNGETT